jgi:hypothetical protein
MPGSACLRQLSGMRLNDFFTQDSGAAQIRPQPGTPSIWRRAPFEITHGETDAIAHKTLKAFARRRVHFWRRLLHLCVFQNHANITRLPS